MKKERAKKVSKALKEVWKSLDSHLPYTYNKHPDGNTFHKKCVKSYAKLLTIIADLY